MIRDTLNANWLISMLRKTFLADKNKLCSRVLPTFLQPSNTIATENHNLLSSPLSGVRRLTGSLSGKSHLLFESKQPFPSSLNAICSGYPIFQDVPSNRCSSWAYREEIREWGERNQLSRCVKTKQRPMFSMAGIWFSPSNRKLQNMSCYLLSNTIQ